jgi:hypothetical protein
VAVHQERLEMADGARTRDDRALAGGEQHPKGLTIASAARLSQVLSRQRLPSSADSIYGVGLGTIASGSSGSVDLDDPLMVFEQVGSKTGAEAPRAPHTPRPGACPSAKANTLALPNASVGTVSSPQTPPLGLTTAAECESRCVSTASTKSVWPSSMPIGVFNTFPPCRAMATR